MAAAPLLPNPSRISRETLAAAVEALLKWIESQPKHQNAQLFEPDDVIYLILTFIRIPSQGRTNPYRIPIPHPLHSFDQQSTSICLFLDDRPSSSLLPSAALDQIRTRNLPISSVIGLSDLKSDYRPYESRRKLCDSYDLFFADRKIIPLLPRLLGKHFFKTKKIPLSVDFSRVGWAEQIESWCSSSLLYLRSGTCSGLKIGRVTQSKDEIFENAVTVIEGAMEFVPKKWGNVRSVHVKTVDSPSLPVYQAIPEIGMKIEGFVGEEGGVRKKKKRVRDDEAKKEKKAKKVKKERVHEVGEIGCDVGDPVEEEVLGLEKNEANELGGEKKRKKRNKDLDFEKEEKDNVESHVDKDMKKKKKKGKVGEVDEGEKDTSKGMKKKKKKGKVGEVDEVEKDTSEELSAKKRVTEDKSDELTIEERVTKGKKKERKKKMEDVSVDSGVMKKIKMKKLRGVK